MVNQWFVQQRNMSLEIRLQALKEKFTKKLKYAENLLNLQAIQNVD